MICLKNLKYFIQFKLKIFYAYIRMNSQNYQMMKLIYNNFISMIDYTQQSQFAGCFSFYGAKFKHDCLVANVLCRCYVLLPRNYEVHYD
ncbi:hypothetical protein VCRA219O19_70067 [Vibrio crassostreae]|nr:hypothetical protein VCRA219O19_70067 [Vibrio crassostreae]